MTEGAIQQPPTVTGFAAKCAIAALHKRNVATQPLLHRAGLTEHAFDNPRHRVSAVGQVKFLEYAAEAMDDTAFGLHLAEQTNPREVGLLFYVASAAKNFGEAWALFARYCRIVNESARLKISRRPEGVVVAKLALLESHGIARGKSQSLRSHWFSGFSERSLAATSGRSELLARMFAMRTCGRLSAPLAAPLSLARRPISSSSPTKRSLFRSSPEIRICWRRCGRSATRRRERATRHQGQSALRSRTRSSGCCRMDELTRKPSPRCWPSASELFREGYRGKARPSRRSLTSCAVASRSSISKSQALHCRKSRGSWATRVRPRSIMPSSVGRGVRHPPPERSSGFPSRHRPGCARPQYDLSVT